MDLEQYRYTRTSPFGSRVAFSLDLDPGVVPRSSQHKSNSDFLKKMLTKAWSHAEFSLGLSPGTYTMVLPVRERL